MNLRKAAPELGHEPTPDATRLQDLSIEREYRNRTIIAGMVAVGLATLGLGVNGALQPVEPQAPTLKDLIVSTGPTAQSTEESGGPFEWIIGPIEDLFG